MNKKRWLNLNMQKICYVSKLYPGPFRYMFTVIYYLISFHLLQYTIKICLHASCNERLKMIWKLRTWLKAIKWITGPILFLCFSIFFGFNELKSFNHHRHIPIRDKKKVTISHAQKPLDVLEVSRVEKDTTTWPST